MITVGIGDYAIADNYEESIITHALGSCVAFMIRCPNTKRTAMAHIVLPETDGTDYYKYIDNKPGYYADIIIPKLIDDFTSNELCQMERLQVSIVGGADSRNPEDVFKVGPRNVEKVNVCLRNYGIRPVLVDVGGNVSRTVEIFVNNGHVEIRRQNMIV